MKKLFNLLKYKVATFILNRGVYLVKRKREVKNFKNAKNIGIVYDATNENTHNIVAEFVKKISNERKNVKALGYVNLKEGLCFHMPKLHYDFFTKKNINWYYKPKGHIVNNFTSEPFDILICLDEVQLAIKYISIYSIAKYKVGKFDESNKKIYDLMIDQKNDDLKDFVQQIFYYLNLIQLK